MRTSDPIADTLDARFHEADARLDSLHARALARRADEEMDQISGLRAARELARWEYVGMTRLPWADIESSRRTVERALHDIEVAIGRILDRIDAVGERRREATPRRGSSG
jgi:hypothetical protein